MDKKKKKSNLYVQVCPVCNLQLILNPNVKDQKSQSINKTPNNAAVNSKKVINKTLKHINALRGKKETLREKTHLNIQQQFY